MPLAKGSSKEVIASNISEMEKSGHPHKQAVAAALHNAYDKAHAAGILMTVGDRALFLKRSGNAQDHPGEWCCPGGSIEGGETPEQAAHREMQEETGYPAGDVTQIDEGAGFVTFRANGTDEFVPVFNEEHSEFKWAPMSDPPQPLHPGMAATLKKMQQATALDKREWDTNGWFEVSDNPLSTIGVYPYSEASVIKGGDRNKVVNVYRSEAELSDPETVKSFQLMPWTDDHPSTLLGDGLQDLVPAEEKGVHGVIGEQTYYRDGTLYGNLKVFSEELARKIAAGKRELSCGYRCDFVPQEGTYEGVPYQYVQKAMRGNHVASVKSGRMGSGVRVLDAAERFTFSLDMRDPIVGRKEIAELDTAIDAKQQSRDPDGKFAAGETARFSGKSAGGEVEGFMPVKVINPWSNKSKVTHTDKRGQSYEGATQHIPTATVERPERKGSFPSPAKQFEAYHYTLSHSKDDAVDAEKETHVFKRNPNRRESVCMICGKGSSQHVDNDDPNKLSEGSWKKTGWGQSNWRKTGWHSRDDKEELTMSNAVDGTFKESDHPRKDDGKFGSGGGKKTKATRMPGAAAAYKSNHTGFDPDIGKRGAHVYEFKNSKEQEKFLNDIGGVPHPLGGYRTILEDAADTSRDDERDCSLDADTQKFIEDSFDSLVDGLEKKGYSKDDAMKMAGKVAAAKGMTGHDSTGAITMAAKDGELKNPEGKESPSKKGDLEPKSANTKDGMNEEEEASMDAAEEEKEDKEAAADAAEEKKDEKDETKEAFDRMRARDKRFGARDAHKGARDARKGARDRAKDARDAAAKGKGMDAAEVQALIAKAVSGVKVPTAAAIIAEVRPAIRREEAAKASLYGRISPIIGAFDHAEMTHVEMAAYGLKKLEAPEAADPVSALDFYLAGRGKAVAPQLGRFAQDTAAGDSFVDKYLNS